MSVNIWTQLFSACLTHGTLCVSLLKILLEDFVIRTLPKFIIQKCGMRARFWPMPIWRLFKPVKKGEMCRSGNIQNWGAITYIKFCELTSFQLKRVQLSCWKPLQRSQYRSFLVPLFQFSSKVAATVVYCFSTGQNGQIIGKKMSMTSLFFGKIVF